MSEETTEAYWQAAIRGDGEHNSLFTLAGYIAGHVLLASGQPEPGEDEGRALHRKLYPIVKAASRALGFWEDE